MNDSPQQVQAAGYVTTVSQLSQVAADRARRFSTLGVTPRWAPLIAGLTLPPLWALHMGIAGIHAGQIRTLQGASVTLKEPRLRRRPWPLTLVGTGVGIAALLITMLLDVASLLVSSAAVNIVCFLLFLLILIVLVRDRRQTRGRARNHPEATDKALAARRAELAKSGEGPAYVFLALVAHADDQHAGWNLVEALKQEWKELHASAVLFPATDRLVEYYTRLGAVIDGDAGRRMVFDYRQSS